MGKLEETVLELVKIHIENILDMKKIMDFIHEVPFQELDIKELEIRKEAKEKEAVRCRELRDYLYEDFREGIISKEDYKELHDGYTEKSWNQKVINIIGWIILPSIRIYRNLQELLLLN